MASWEIRLFEIKQCRTGQSITTKKILIGTGSEREPGKHTIDRNSYFILMGHFHNSHSLIIPILIFLVGYFSDTPDRMS
jgi:hypothetical protein